MAKLEHLTLKKLIDGITNEIHICMVNLRDPDKNESYLRGKINAYENVSSMLGIESFDVTVTPRIGKSHTSQLAEASRRC